MYVQSTLYLHQCLLKKEKSSEIRKLKQALCGTHLEVPTLLGEPLHLCTKGEVTRLDLMHRLTMPGNYYEAFLKILSLR